MSSDLVFRVVEFGSPEYVETVALRDDILRRPLGLHFTPELLGEEAHDIHLACYRNDDLAGCLILVPLADGDIKMRQVAVAADAQRTGVGSALVKESERIAFERGFARMVLNARLTAVPFYLRLGYLAVGEEFLEVTIPHHAMEKHLP